MARLGSRQIRQLYPAVFYGLQQCALSRQANSGQDQSSMTDDLSIRLKTVLVVESGANRFGIEVVWPDEQVLCAGLPALLHLPAQSIHLFTVPDQSFGEWEGYGPPAYTADDEVVLSLRMLFEQECLN